MLNRTEAKDRNDVFTPLSARQPKGVYFLRLSVWSKPLEDFIWQYHEEARQRGIIVENQLGNPDDRQLAYYTDVLGTAFEPTTGFVSAALQKWMPRMSPSSRMEFADSICRQLAEMKAAGKNDNILKNVYIKMMCWLYYKFERSMPFLGGDQVPKVLYEGNSITRHELIFLRMLNAIGTDILLLETQSDDAYMRLDPANAWSQKLNESDAGSFPPDFSLKNLRRERARAAAAPAPRPAIPPRPSAQRPTVPVRPGNPASPAGPSARPAASARQGLPAQSRPAAPVRPSASPRPAAPAAPQVIDIESRFPAPARKACTNAWMKKAEMDQILQPPVVRGDDPKLFYNAFIRVTGARDKLTYTNELFQLYQQLTVNQRKVLIVDGKIPDATPEEIAKIRRRNYRSPDELIVDLAGNLPSCASVELQRSIQHAFIRSMRDAAKSESNLNKLTVTAVIILCWIQRYQGKLFQGWKENDIPCFIKMGPCETAQEALYVSFLSQLPVDVLVLSPNLNQVCAMQADNLLEIKGNESLPLMPFPKQSGVVQMRTFAAHAEEDLTGILYQDSGIYRNRQFDQAETITLQTTYDEIFILWDQELKYRPNFSTGDHTANIPVLYAKISGVEDGKVLAYWQKIKLLRDAQDTLLITQMPFIRSGDVNPFQALAVKGIKNEKLLREVIKGNRQYPFGLLREEMQEHIFDKLQQMLDQRLIKGTFMNGTEYTILATVLNMKKEVVRLVQGFDFTRKNPKLVVINTKDQLPSLEDAIMLTFLNKLGFDIVLFVPTGYQMIERYLNDNFPVEHQIGEYVYDLSVPDFSKLPQAKGPSRLKNLFRR